MGSAMAGYSYNCNADYCYDILGWGPTYLNVGTPGPYPGGTLSHGDP